MNTSELYFLSVASELSISKAAKQLYISQQDLSKHIRKLEKKLGVELFYRKPVFKLSPYGEAYRNSLERIRIIEAGLHKEFSEIQNEKVGTIRFGIHFTRARVILPRIYASFSRLHPGITTSIIYGESHELIKKLEKDEIDLMLGINVPSISGISEEYITTENIFLILPNKLLFERFGADADKLRLSFSDEGADMRLLQGTPFISNDFNSQAQRIFDMHLNETGVSLMTSLRSTDHYGNIFLAGAVSQACCVPQTLLDAARVYNMNRHEINKLSAFRIKGLDHSLRISVLYNTESFVPQYAKSFIQIVKDEALNASEKYKNGLH